MSLAFLLTLAYRHSQSHTSISRSKDSRLKLICNDMAQMYVLWRTAKVVAQPYFVVRTSATRQRASTQHRSAQHRLVAVSLSADLFACVTKLQHLSRRLTLYPISFSLMPLRQDCAILQANCVSVVHWSTLNQRAIPTRRSF